MKNVIINGVSMTEKEARRLKKKDKKVFKKDSFQKKVEKSIEKK